MSPLFADGEMAQSVSSTSWTLVAASIAWVAVWVQLVVIPFFNKRESLHKDYFASGRINSALAALEANELIPALAAMFVKATDAQPDKRKRPEKDIAALLQSVQFLLDLENARKVMASMEEIRRSYDWLNNWAAWLWKVGFIHAVLTPFIPIGYLLMPFGADWKDWILGAIIVMWGVTIAACIYGLLVFHHRLGRFVSALEVEDTTD